MVEWLDNNHDVKRWEVEELKGIYAHYRAKLRDIIGKITDL
jgi:hypothetical protein